MDLNRILDIDRASVPETRSTAIAPAPEAVARAIIVSLCVISNTF